MENQQFPEDYLQMLKAGGWGSQAPGHRHLGLGLEPGGARRSQFRGR